MTTTIQGAPRRWFWPSRLRTQVALLGAILLLISSVALTGYLTYRHVSEELETSRNDAVALARTLAISASSRLLIGRYGQIEETMQLYIDFPGVMKITVISPDGNTLIAVQKGSNGTSETRLGGGFTLVPTAESSIVQIANDQMIVWQPIEGGTVIGWIKLEYSLESLRETQASTLWHGVIIGLIAVFASVALFLLLLESPMRAIGRAAEFARQLNQRRGETFEADRSALELEQLGDALNEASLRLMKQERNLTTAMAELSDSEREARKLASIVETAMDAVVSMDTHGMITQWNQQAEVTFGWSAAEAVGKNLVDLIIPYQYRAAHIAGLERYLSTGATTMIGRRIETTALRRSGNEFPVAISITELGSGGDRSFSAFVSDISVRKAADNALRDMVTMQQAIQDSAAYAIISTRTDGTITTFNKAAERLLGYRAEEVINKHTPAILHDTNEVVARAADFSAELDAPITPGFEVFVAKSRRKLPNEHEWTYVRKDGSRVPVLLTVTALRAPDDSITGFLGIAADISERKRWEAGLQEAKERAEAASRAKSSFVANMSHEIRTPLNAVIGLSHLLLDTTLDAKQRDFMNRIHSSSQALLGILNDILDYSKIEAGRMDIEAVDFMIDAIFDTAASLFAIKAEEKNIKLSFEVTPSAQRPLRGDALRLGQIVNNLVGNAVKFTEKGEIHVFADAVPDADGRVRLEVHVRDSGIGLTPTQRERLFEAFSQADASTTRNYGGSGLGLSISKHLVEMMGGSIGVISEAGRGSTFHFSVALEPARSAPRTPEDLRSLKTLIIDDQETSIVLLEAQLRAWGFTVETSTDPVRGLQLIHDAATANAPYELIIVDWKMQGMDGIELVKQIDTIALARAPLIAVVTAYGSDFVADAGMSTRISDVLEKPIAPARLFEVIQAHQGGMRRTTQAKGPVDAQRLQDMTQPIRGARILLVEDNHANQVVAVAFLESMGLKVEVAENGQEAVDKSASTKYDLILMDLQMPVMDGFEATRTIRVTENGKSTPILAMTAAALISDQQLTLQAGMNQHLSKPIMPLELASALLKWIPHRK